VLRTSVVDDVRSLSALLQRKDPMRREATGGVKVSARGLMTRTALLKAASSLFSQHGYQPTTVALIAAEAGTSLGTYYQYFSDRADILTALVAEEVTALLADDTRTWHVQDGPEGLRPFLHAYVAATAENAAFWRVWEEVTHTEENLADVRRELVRLVNRGVAAQIVRGQQAGLVHASVDPRQTAAALTAMVDRYIYVTYIFDPPHPPPVHSDSVAVLAEIWAQAVFGRGLA